MFKLPAELTIAHVEACRASLLELIEQAQEITLSDEDVVRIDTVGVQLILSIVTYLSLQNKTLHWCSSSKAVQHGFEQLGISEPLLNKHFVK